MDLTNSDLLPQESLKDVISMSRGRGPRRSHRRSLSEIEAAARREEDRQLREAGEQNSGTFYATSFKSRPNRDDPNRVNHYFNSPGDGTQHGHVQEIRHEDDSVTYPYVRDVEGNEYDT